MSGYGQFCPVATTLEIVGERWTLLLVRELMCGSHRFSDLQRGLPLISRSVLSHRLRTLCEAGVVERRTGEYHLTPAGEELRPIVLACGEWGTRWAGRTLKNADVDLTLLMWDMRRRIDVAALPEREVWVRFEFRGAPRGARRFWLRLHRPEVELCLTDPHRDVAIQVHTSPAIMGEVWLGNLQIPQAMKTGGMVVAGPRDLVRAFPRWLQRSIFADVERPANE